MAYAAILPYPGVGWPHLLGFLAVGGTLLLARRPVPNIEAVYVLTYGIYLVHPIFLMVGFKIADSKPIVAVVAFCGSVVLVYLIRRLGGRLGRLVT